MSVSSGERVLCFAYGSNMCEGRMRSRVPSAHFVGVARLEAHSLRFHKKSEDGSGKADAYLTSDPRDYVLGVIYEIERRKKRDLDEAEGLGAGYTEKTVDVITPDGRTLKTQMYFAEKGSISPSLRPYSWYKRFVLEGARQTRFAPRLC